MDEPLVIKYTTNSGGFDLGILGESFSGLDSVLKDICSLAGVNGDVEIRTSRIENGSVEIFNFIHVNVISAPFLTPQELFDFLKIASPVLLRAAQDYFSSIGGEVRSVELFLESLGRDVFVSLLADFIIRSFNWSGKLKNNPIPRDGELGEITNRQAGRLRSLVSSGKFKRVMKPIVEGNISGISLVNNSTAEGSRIAVNLNNVDNYLPDDERILPELINGESHEFTGEVVGLQTRGETIKIVVIGIDPSNNLLTAHPSDGQDTADFAEYYKKQVIFTAEVVRSSMFRRPELVVSEMRLLQEELFSDLS